MSRAENLARNELGKLTYMGVELPPGPWHDEVDHANFEAHGLACIIHRGPLGALCGYVSVPPGHPWHGKYDDTSADVWGGITYAQKCTGPICHVAKPGAPDDVWWLGFDCCHLGDVVPAMLAINARAPSGFFVGPSPWGESYKTFEFVRQQTEQLAAQAMAVAP